MLKNRMEYKDYVGTVEWHDDLNIFRGEVLHIRNCLIYEGKNINQLRNNFHKCIDNYIKTCENNNLKVDIPFKGSFNVRISDDLYRLLCQRAKKDNISINKVVSNAIEEYTKHYFI